LWALVLTNVVARCVSARGALRSGIAT
jgi:hypothetical protein